MIRDQIKDLAYYEDIIQQLKQRIDKYEKKRDEFVDDSPQYEKCQVHLQGIYYNYISACYSAGFPVSEIRETVKKYLSTITPASITYNTLIDAYALAILFDISSMSNPVISQNKYHDKLIDCLAQFNNGKTISISQNNPQFTEYLPFCAYLNDQLHKDELLQYIEKDWYGSCSDRAWFDTDKSPEHIYYGYWCWIGGAVLKLKSETVDRIVPYLPIIE